MGIDITCAFGSEKLDPGEDIYVQYPPIMVEKFGYLFDQQRKEQKIVLAEEARMVAEATKATTAALIDGSMIADNDVSDEEDVAAQNIRSVTKQLSSCRGHKNPSNRKRDQARYGKSRVRGVSQHSQRRQRVVAKLRMSLYGLRRAAKKFNKGLTKLLNENGYESCPVDKCIFRKVSGDESILFNTHVDDFACFPTCEAMYDELCAVLRTKYTITETRNLVKHLGMHVNEYANGSVGISQPKHLQTLF
jgi:hypothetical protein